MDAINTELMPRFFPFSVRVYGILCHENKLLLSEEYWQNIHMIKFPGGGLEYGESISECLHREFKEELKIDITSSRFLHIPDIFIPASIYAGVQVIPIYFEVKVAQPSSIKTVSQFMESSEKVEGAQHFHWIQADERLDTLLSFVGDKIALKYYMNSKIDGQIDRLT